MSCWDIIGDIHGQIGKLEGILRDLGYDREGGAYRHEERKALFLGDYIDRGPGVREVLHIVKDMVDAGEAVAIMGNHELNAILFHHNGRDGKPLRAHTPGKVRQHAATLEQFEGRGEEWGGWLRWFSKLPLCHEDIDIRAVHACWSERHFSDLNGADFSDPTFLARVADTWFPEGRAAEVLLKGPELRLPEGQKLRDKDGETRDSMRVRWWDIDAGGVGWRDLVMPPGGAAPDGQPDISVLEDLPNYPIDAKPVFCGHYWLPFLEAPNPMARNVMCVDYSAGKGGPLVACRWNGSIDNSEFLWSWGRD